MFYNLFYRKESRGFTLLEVLISLVITGGVLITVLYTLHHHLNILERHETVTIATMLAREKILDMGKSGIKEEKGSFPEPYEEYSFKSSTYASTMPEVVIKEVRVKKGGEEISVKRYVVSVK